MAGPAAHQLSGCAVLEQDKDGDELWTWVYPALAPGVRAAAQRTASAAFTAFTGSKASGDEDGEPAAAAPASTARRIGRFGGTWFYIAVSSVSTFPDTAAAAFVVSAKDFHPDKYLSLAEILLGHYIKDDGKTASLLTTYLGVFARGQCRSLSGSKYSAAAFELDSALMEHSVSDAIEALGVEVILVYTAILLKKRVAVFCPDAVRLASFCIALTQLVWRRHAWDRMYPEVHLSDDELAMLGSLSHYVAGFTEPEIENREQLFDVFVNVPAGSVSVASHATDAFGMGKIHKDIAKCLVAAAASDDEDDASIIESLKQRTDDIVGGLTKLATPLDTDPEKLVVTIEAIKARKMAPSMHTFLQNLASAENMLAVQ